MEFIFSMPRETSLHSSKGEPSERLLLLFIYELFYGSSFPWHVVYVCDFLPQEKNNHLQQKKKLHHPCLPYIMSKISAEEFQ